MKKVVILGAAGYIGSTLCSQLLKDENIKVLAVDNFYKGSCDTLIPFVSNDRFEFAFGDVTDEVHMSKLLDGADVIVQLAGLVGFPICEKYKSLAHSVNVYGMYVVLKHRPENCKLIYSSTGSCYGAVEGLCTEETPTYPLSWYGQTKLTAEKLTLEEENTIVHRYATAFGVGYNTTRVNLLINDLTYQAINNRSLNIFQADFFRTFIHVKDICESIYHTMINFDDMHKKHRVYNVGHKDLNFSKREIVEIIKEKTGCHVTYAEVGQDMDQRNYRVDYSRIYDSGWEAKIDIEQGINELIKVTPLLTGWNSYR